MQKSPGLCIHCIMSFVLNRPLRSIRRRLFPVYIAKNRRNESHYTSGNDEDLPEEKRKVLDLVLDGASLFIGGDAGTGKTYLLRRIADVLKAKGLRVAVTASTGIAALRIGGNTFHSTFGVPVISGDERCMSSGGHGSFRIHYDADALASIDAIIIDEISLLHSGYIEALEVAARSAPMRRHDVPFGGIQIILSGDFMQLMHGNYTSKEKSQQRIVCAGVKKTKDSLPEVDTKALSSFTDHSTTKCGGSASHSFHKCHFIHKPLFEDPAFLKCLLHVRLCTQMRQSVDTEFTEDLTQLRSGVLTHRLSRSAMYNSKAPDAIHLFPTKRAVSAFNERKLFEISEPERVFRSKLEVITNDGAESLSSKMRAVIVVHFRSKSMRSDIWRQRAEELMHRIADECGLGNVVYTMIPPVPPRYSTHLTVYVRLMGGKEKSGREPIAVMLRAIGAKLLGKSPEAVAARKVWGTVMWEVRQPDFFVRNMRSSIERLYDKTLQQETVLNSKRLKIGCRVMLLRNLSKEFVNGSIGTIVRFEPLHRVTHLLPKDLRQFLAPKSFAALRSKPIVSGGTEETESTEIDYDLRSNSEEVIPVVRIDRLGDDDDDDDTENKGSQEVAIPWISLPLLGAQRNGFCSVRVTVMPLTPAYAFTVHKVQGLTFDRPVLFDAEGFFPCDHLIYVAASRVKRYSQFRMINVSPRMVTVHRGALHFTLGIPTTEEAVEKWRQWAESAVCPDEQTHVPNSFILSLFRASWKTGSALKRKTEGTRALVG